MVCRCLESEATEVKRAEEREKNGKGKDRSTVLDIGTKEDLKRMMLEDPTLETIQSRKLKP